MDRHRLPPALVAVSLLVLCGAASSASAKTEIAGAAILDHPCGKVSVQQMGLIHAGKFDEANRLTTPQMQDQWKAMPAKDREMMAGMAKDMSQSPEEFANDVKASGQLVVDGQDAKLTVQTKHQDANGSSTSTMTQTFKVEGAHCLVSR